jgi:hypothetical protein
MEVQSASQHANLPTMHIGTLAPVIANIVAGFLPLFADNKP